MTACKMATISALAKEKRSEIKELLDVGGHYKDVVEYLKETFPDVSRGISLRSVRRYCKKENLVRFSSKKYDDRETERIVRRASFEVETAPMIRFGGKTLETVSFFCGQRHRKPLLRVSLKSRVVSRQKSGSLVTATN